MLTLEEVEDIASYAVDPPDVALRIAKDTAASAGREYNWDTIQTVRAGMRVLYECGHFKFQTRKQNDETPQTNR